MTKFNVDDKVIIFDSLDEIPSGSIGTIVEILEDELIVEFQHIKKTAKKEIFERIST